MNDTIISTTSNALTWWVFMIYTLKALQIGCYIFVGYHIIKLYKAVLRYVCRFDNDME
ncbi:hypothetical protein IMCC3317_24700 [Kordia antarctica]|uniref:Uncharacterized protein n=1 Tax=Kordia antarctica TaxID=1218801 RepID=A0A7L4ZKD2_9FLAO|nr:hypothetical protein IMCC3317_24700 [Kordia antarctica]